MQLPINYDTANAATRRLAREAYVRVQDGLCQHCNEKLSGHPSASVREKKVNWKLFPPNFTRWPVHLHHSHETGMTIGAVHALCNAVLWQYHGE